MPHCTSAFLAPIQISVLGHALPRSRSQQSYHRFSACSKSSWPSRPSTALHRTEVENGSSSQYIDLRTMKVIQAVDAHFRENAPTDHPTHPPPGFQTLKDIENITELPSKQRLNESLFTADTIPLSETQRAVVQTLLSHRSVVCTVVAGDEKDAVLLDIVMRNRVWKELIVYCAASRRAAESTFTSLCAQLGPERRNEVVLNLGDGSSFTLDSESDVHFSNNTRVIITSPTVLKRAIANCESEMDSWAASASVIFVDHLTEVNLHDWEETLISLPSKTLMCALTRELSQTEKDFLPLWLESIQNTVASVNPPGASSLLSRIEQPQNFPLLRTFAFNAALHEYPVQVSLTILKEILVKELENSDEDFVPDFAESFLQGITMIPAENPADLLFEHAGEAKFADVAALVIADAKRTAKAMRSKSRRRPKGKKKERTPASRAAARRRREAAYADGLLLPAIVLVRGHTNVEEAATGLRSAIGNDVELLWDDDTRDHVEEIVYKFKSTYNSEMTETDERLIGLLACGIGVVHERCTPCVRTIVEELFRGGFIPLLIVDTHIGSTELCSLPSSKSVLVEADVLATCDDQSKGLIVASTPVSLAGRVGKDDVGNLIMLWYHESIDDETAGHEIASNLLMPVLSSQFPKSHAAKSKSNKASGHGFDEPHDTWDSVQERQGTRSLLSTTYDSVLRSMRRFGIDGYESIAEYSLNSFKQWAERGALHATLEKLSIEKKAIDETFGDEDWDSIAEYNRLVGKVNEAERVLKAMTTRYEAVRNHRVLDELKTSRPGRIIGIRTGAGDSSIPNADNAASTPRNVPKSGKESEGSPDHDEGSSDRGTLVTMEKKGENMVAASLICVFDQEGDGPQVSEVEYRYLAVCILGDGAWTMVPVSDVIALADEHDVVSNVDVLVMPHPATFDVDPETAWARCAPIDGSEQSTLHKVSDELIGRMTADDRPRLVTVGVGEFDTQNELVQTTRKQLSQSPWFGREDEMNDLRRLRRRSAELTDEIKGLKSRKDLFESELMEKHNDLRGVQTALMAVLEDCHAISFAGEQIEMTPIGALASVLPCKFPVFAGACLSLIDDLESLSAPQFAAFVALVVCDSRSWIDPSPRTDVSTDTDLDEPLDMSPILASGANKNDSEGILGYGEQVNGTEGFDGRPRENGLEAVENLLPTEIRNSILEIQKALYQLHRRHLDDCQGAKKMSISDVVPHVQNSRLSEAVYQFVDGAPWNDVAERLGNFGGYAVTEMRRVCEVLRIICEDEVCGEFSDETREISRAALRGMSRWPVRDIAVVKDLLESGVVERQWSGNTYDKWWRSARDELLNLCARDGDSGQPQGGGVAEVGKPGAR